MDSYNTTGKKLYTASIILGAIGIFTGALIWPIGSILGIIGIVLAVLHKETHKIAFGMVLSVLSVIGSGISLALAQYISSHPELIEQAVAAANG